MNNIDPLQSIFYCIDKTIKVYKKYAQNQISKAGIDITLDQTLALILINNDLKFSQSEIAKLLFKDYASVTRIIEILVRNSFVSRSTDNIDRRKTSLELTLKGKTTIEKLEPIIFQNRKNALNSIPEIELINLKLTLNRIVINCKNNQK